MNDNVIIIQKIWRSVLEKEKIYSKYRKLFDSMIENIVNNIEKSKDKM